MNLIKLAKRKIRRFNSQKYFSKAKYLDYFEKLPINSNLIYLESQQGKNLNGNIFYIIKELCQNNDYLKFELVLGVNEAGKKKSEELLSSYGLINRVKIVLLETKDHYKTVTTAKYLFTDTSFYTYFVKKEGQIIINTWHGTPLKTLGRHIKDDFHRIGNIQKNFMISDYLLYPNEFTKDSMIDSYYLNDICPAKTILGGYPRNEAFFDKARATKIKNELSLNGKQTYAYMPTWRGVVGKVQNEINFYLEMLSNLDNQLNDNQILYVNFHPFLKNAVSFEGFKHIKEFPKKYETYDFLNAIDVLITDYSSVFFDFANTRRKVILYCYDKDEYFETRGTYFPIDSLPFPICLTLDELLIEMGQEKNYDDSEFVEKFCSYDNANASYQLCQKVFFNRGPLNEENIPNNGKKNILIYAGTLKSNGITISLTNLLNTIDTTKYNYFLTFTSSKITKNKEYVLNLPEGIRYFATAGMMNTTFNDRFMIQMYRRDVLKMKHVLNRFKFIFSTEIKRLFGNAKFDHVIQFSGYDYKQILLYAFAPFSNTIYVHSNMVEEMSLKGNQHKQTLEYAYRNYDNVAVVSEDIRKPTFEISKKNENIKVCSNIIRYRTIRTKAKQDVMFDEITESNVSYERVLKVLNSNSKKFINVGRYSVEKGHKRLMDAFDTLWQDNHDLYLIIVGGNGPVYKEEIEYANSKKSANNILLIKDMSNPFAVVDRCDYFVFSSFHEGFGLALIEANIVGKPVISTNIPGPRGFMEKYNGELVEDSTEGLIVGMKKLLNNEIPVLDIDYREYNADAVNSFESLFNK